MMKDLVCSVVTALQPSAELKKINLVTDFNIDFSRPIWGDRLKLQKICLNLISNAIKYTPNGGTVNVSLTEMPTDVPDCKYSLIVEDNGIGMSEEFMQKMYEPFAQEKRSEAVNVQGTGLGLAIVKRYVDLMGGKIDVRSKLHHGTRWIVSIPTRAVSEGYVCKKETGAVEHSLAGRHVLLCEDNYMNTEIAVMLLKEKGILVDTAENGKEGLEKLSASDNGTYDAILMDIRMPVMDGCEATRKIRALDRPDAKQIPIIAMTADAFEESIREAEEAGIDDYTTKPIEPGKLFQALSKAIGK